jgi:hypothetical protein
MPSLPTTDCRRHDQLVRDSYRAFSPNLAGSHCYRFEEYQISLIGRPFDDEDALFQRTMPILNDVRDGVLMDQSEDWMHAFSEGEPDVMTWFRKRPFTSLCPVPVLKFYGRTCVLKQNWKCSPGIFFTLDDSLPLPASHINHVPDLLGNHPGMLGHPELEVLPQNLHRSR